jgi:hypothetical protein
VTNNNDISRRSSNRTQDMDPQLLSYYEAIERASADMLNAAREGKWDEVLKLEGACVLLISQLKHKNLPTPTPTVKAQRWPWTWTQPR